MTDEEQNPHLFWPTEPHPFEFNHQENHHEQQTQYFKVAPHIAQEYHFETANIQNIRNLHGIRQVDISELQKSFKSIISQLENEKVQIDARKNVFSLLMKKNNENMVYFREMSKSLVDLACQIDRKNLEIDIESETLNRWDKKYEQKVSRLCNQIDQFNTILVAEDQRISLPSHIIAPTEYNPRSTIAIPLSSSVNILGGSGVVNVRNLCMNIQPDFFSEFKYSNDCGY